MAVGSHLSELAEKHRRLDVEIEKLLSSPSSNDLELQKLKRRKLKIKDEIERLSMQTH